MTEAPRSRTMGDLIVRNIATLFAGRGLGTVISAGAAILLARYLGREQLGHYGAVYAFVGLFAWIATFGIEPILGREAAQRRELAGSILFTGTVLTSLFASVATIGVLALAPFFGYGGALWPLLLMAAIDTFLFAPLRLPGIVFQVDLRQWYAVSFGLVRQLLWFGAIVVLAFGKAGLFWLIFARTACGAVEVILTLVAVWHRGLLPRPWKFLPSEAKLFLVYCAPIAVSVLAINVYHRIDQVMLHKMSTDQILGGYVAAVSMAEIFSLFPVALTDSIFPILAKSVGNPVEFDRYLGFSFRALMALVFGICAVAAPLSGPLTKLLFGMKYTATAPIFAVLIWSEVAIFFGVTMKMAVVSFNHQRFLAVSTIIGAIVNVVLNLFWIPRYGALGATWATNISYSIASIFIYLLFAPTRHFAWLGLRISFPAFLLSLAIGGLLSVSPLPVLVNVVLGVILYGAGAWLTGVIGREELQRVWRLVTEFLPGLRSKAA